MTRILITGATGRVGGVVARGLAAEHDVVALARFGADSSRTELERHGITCVAADLRGSLTDLPPAVRHAQMLLHFAVSFSPDWPEALEVNAASLGVLVERLPRLERLLYCSTMGVYASADDRPLDEAAPLGDVTSASMPTYSISKIAGEAVARAVARGRGLPTTIARLGAPYGDHGGLPWFLLLDILADRPVTLHPSSPCRFNLIHEDDLLASLPLLLDAASVPATVLNWGDPEPTSAEDWVAEMGRLVGREPTIVRHPAAPPPGPLDTSALAALGFRPRVAWRDGLRRMVRHRHPEEYVG